MRQTAKELVLGEHSQGLSQVKLHIWPTHLASWFQHDGILTSQGGTKSLRLTRSRDQSTKSSSRFLQNFYASRVSSAKAPISLEGEEDVGSFITSSMTAHCEGMQTSHAV